MTAPISLPGGRSESLLPSYPTLPAVRIGRLTVDEKFQGQGRGAAALMNAAQRTWQAAPAAFAMLVDAKNEQAIEFYRHQGSRALLSQPRTLFLPLATLQKAFAQTQP